LSEHSASPHLADSSFDFVYSFDFFPHLASRGMILDFLREVQHVLRPGGLARMEFPGGQFTSQDLLEFAQTNNFQVLALEGAATPSLWTTWRKQPGAWQESLAARIDAPGESQPVIIRRITNASSFEPVAPCRGRYASIVLRVENLAPDAGIQHLRVTIGSSLGTVTYLGPADRNGCQQIHVDLPELEATGLLPVQVFWLDHALSEPATLRVIPPGPLVPRVVSTAKRVESRVVNITLEEIARPWEIEVSLGGHAVEDVERICMDPRPQRYAVNFRLPEDIAAGSHEVSIHVGRRKLPPVAIEVK
jgi:SAM-dependent methyltransferase